jgi:ArsR family transcriptional regulator
MKVDKATLNEKSQVLKALGHPIRLCIVKGLLEQGENNVSYMQYCLDVPQSTLSQHLAKLKAAGIIDCERKGTEVYYKVVNEEAIKIIKSIF